MAVRSFTAAEDAVLRDGYLSGNTSDYMLARWCRAHGVERRPQELRRRVGQLDYFRRDQPWLKEAQQNLQRAATLALAREIRLARAEATTAPPFRLSPSEIEEFLRQ